MAEITFRKATKQALKMRLGIEGASGSGKTLTALKIAQWLCEREGGRFVVIDTEHRSSEDYADQFDFDVYSMANNYSPEHYHEVVVAAEDAGYTVIVIDSLTHEWRGAGGVLSRTPKAQDWKVMRPLHRKLIEKIMWSNAHIICTMRSEERIEINKEPGQAMQVVKLGLGAIQDKDLPYEFQAILSMDRDHVGTVTKYRNQRLALQPWPKPGDDFAAVYYKWLTDGDMKPLIIRTKNAWLHVAAEIGLCEGERPTAAEAKKIQEILGDTNTELETADAAAIRRLGQEGAEKLRAWKAAQEN